jgi:hypothetical protein
MIECDNIPALAKCLAKIPPKNGRYLEEKMLMARNRQGISESMKLIEVHYNLGNDLYEYVKYFTISVYISPRDPFGITSHFELINNSQNVTSFPSSKFSETCLTKI